MDNTTSTVQQSTQYSRFKFMFNNRDQSRGHIEALKKAFEEVGNLTEVQPILVNEKFEIIDGQHRFVAAKDLGAPIFFTVRPGLGISDARSMNILHRSWTTDDFAQSYASSGDPNYVKYLQLREDYGFNHSITIAYVEGGENKGMFAGFRRGDFVLTDEAGSRNRLDKLSEVLALTPVVGVDKNFAFAFLKVLNTQGYDHNRMLQKLEAHPELMRRYGSISEYMRAMEEIYNYGNREAGRVRLY